jgi:hypothetical protein
LIASVFDADGSIWVKPDAKAGGIAPRGDGVVQGGGSAVAEDLSAASTRAGNAVGPGRGPVYGTRVHSAFEAEVKGLGNGNLATEVSYRNGQVVPRGTAGSVRVDVVEGRVNAPTAVYDLKTGSATLTPARIQQLQQHILGWPNVIEVRP